MALQDNIRHPSAAAIFLEIPELAEDMVAKPQHEDTLAFLAQLAAGDTPEEAVTFAAHMLRPRLSVWWGHECLKSASEILSPQDEQMLQLAANWVADPSEENRYAAMDHGTAAKDKTPGVWLALAAAWSGGSLVGPELEPVPPSPVICGRAVNASTLTMLAMAGTEQRAERIQGLISMADILARSE